MKVKEYIRLGKISIKSRKKSTRNTVRGIAFGLILLVPIVFFTLAFYLDLTTKINETKNISSFYVDAVDENSTQDGVFKNYSLLLFGNSDVDALEKRVDKEIEDIVYSQRYALNNRGSGTSSIKIGDVKKTISNNNDHYGDNDSKQVSSNYDIKVIDRERSRGKLFPEGFEKDLESAGKTVFAAGGGFSESGKGEIIISEMLAKEFGINVQSAIDSKVTLTAAGNFESKSSYENGPYQGYYLDNDNNPNNTYAPPSEEGGFNENMFSVDVLRDFKIVGVISSEYFALNSQLSSDANLWICESSAYEVSGGVRTTKYLPSLSTGEVENDNGWTYEYQIVTYPQTGIDGIVALSEQAAEEQMFFPAIPALTFSTGKFAYSSDMPESPYVSLTVQCKDYNSATKIETLLNNGYSRISGEELSAFGGGYVSYQCVTDAYSNFSMLHQIGLYLMIIMYTFGGIIFFATLLNLYNSVNYSVQVRRNYIGMMRAIGAKQNVIPRLYFVEILLIFWRSFLWVLIFGGGISFGIKALVDMLFKQEAAAMLGAQISLNFGWFFVALVAVIAVVFLIAFLFSRVSCRSVTHKGILEVLSDDK